MSLSFALRDLAAADAGESDDTLSAMGEEEFRLFYERTARPLWAYLSRLTGDGQKADDLLQEAYYRFYRAAARHDNETHRRNSLFRIATNLVRDAARYERHRVEVSLDQHAAAGHELAAAAPTPEQQVAAESDLRRAMSRLDPAQRELLWLAYAQGESHHQIAAILGVRSISVRTLLLRARRKLAALLGEGRPVRRGRR